MLRHKIIWILALVLITATAGNSSWLWVEVPPIDQQIEEADLVVIGAIVAERDAGEYTHPLLPGLESRWSIGTLEIDEVLWGELPSEPVELVYESEVSTTASLLHHLGDSGGLDPESQLCRDLL